MPKSKTRRKKAKSSASAEIPWGGSAAGGTRRLNIAIAVVALLAVLAGGAYWVNGMSVEREFLALAEQGRERLGDVVREPNLGRRHLATGESYRYADAFPTSGPHAPVWAKTGFHSSAPPAILLVHALEHGNVIVYYDAPGDEVIDTLKDWTALYGGQWDGMLAVPRPGLGPSVVLNAWVQELTLERFDPAVAAAFIDAYRGRGPEHPVR